MAVADEHGNIFQQTHGGNTMKPKTEKRAFAGGFMSLCFFKSAHAFLKTNSVGSCRDCWFFRDNGYLEGVGFFLLGVTVFALVIYLTKDEE